MCLNDPKTGFSKAGNSEKTQPARIGWAHESDDEIKFTMSFTPEMQIGWRELGSPQCSQLNTVSPFFREGNLREHLGKPPVKNELLLKKRSLEETAAKLNTGFRGRFLNENVKTRFLPSGAAMGMGKFEFPGALDHWLGIRPHQAFAFHSLTNHGNEEEPLSLHPKQPLKCGIKIAPQVLQMSWLGCVLAVTSQLCL